MRFDLDMGDEDNYSINAYEDGKIIINKITYTQTVLVGPKQLITDLPVKQISDLNLELITRILSLNPKVLLIGTGKTLIFPNAALLAPLYQKNIGVECMTTRSACHTYDVLMAEGRDVIALLFL